MPLAGELVHEPGEPNGERHRGGVGEVEEVGEVGGVGVTGVIIIEESRSNTLRMN